MRIRLPFEKRPSVIPYIPTESLPFWKMKETSRFTLDFIVVEGQVTKKRTCSLFLNAGPNAWIEVIERISQRRSIKKKKRSLVLNFFF